MPIVIAAEPEYMYFIELYYDNGDISLQSLDVKLGYAPDRKNMADGYTIKMQDYLGQESYAYSFDFATRVYDTDIIELSETSKLIILPYLPTITSINLYDSSNIRILSIDVSQYANYCGDEICSEFESDIICPSDCSKPKQINYIPYLVGIFIIIILLVIVTIIKRKSTELR